MILVYQTFKQTEVKNRKYRFTLNVRNSNNNESKKKKKKQKQKVATGGISDEVKRQSIRYSSAFFIVWTFPTISRIIQMWGDIHPILAVLSGTSIGLQGFFNALIYFRPRYNKCIKYKTWYRKVWAIVYSTLFFCLPGDDYTKDNLDYVADSNGMQTNAMPRRGSRYVPDSGDENEEKVEDEDERCENSCGEEESAIPTVDTPA